MFDKPDVAAVIDAARLLNVELLWDPDRYPQGPTDSDRHLLMAAVAVQAENLRSAEVRPERIAEMREVYARAFQYDMKQMATHVVAALDFLAQLLEPIMTPEGAAEDAMALMKVAVSILATSLAEIPYQHVNMAALNAPCNVPGCACGGAGSGEHA